MLSHYISFLSALQSVGLFRRSGGKQRIHQLKTLMEENPGMVKTQIKACVLLYISYT